MQIVEDKHILRACFFFSIVTNKGVQIHSLENINNGDLFEAGHNLEGWISTADQRLLLRKHTTWNSYKRADGVQRAPWSSPTRTFCILFSTLIKDGPLEPLLFPTTFVPLMYMLFGFINITYNSMDCRCFFMH